MAITTEPASAARIGLRETIEGISGRAPLAEIPSIHLHLFVDHRCASWDLLLRHSRFFEMTVMAVMVPPPTRILASFKCLPSLNSKHV